jgi:hypothetical protein
VKLRKSCISGDEPLPVLMQCHQVDVNRTCHCEKPKQLSSNDDDLLLMRLIDEE